MCKIACVAAALIRVLYLAAVAAPAKSLLAAATVAFSLVNAPCLRYMNQAALGRSFTGTFCGDLLAGAMAHSWRLLVQGLTSFMFLCARADEYVRPPPSQLVLMAHDKPASHPQQVRALRFRFIFCSVCCRVCKNFLAFCLFYLLASCNCRSETVVLTSNCKIQ
jgi:acid phosphatase type 7